MFKFFVNFIFLFFLFFEHALAVNNFDQWKIQFKSQAVNSGISEKVVNEIMKNAKFLPKVIEYDRYQPEFYEDTKTYINIRTNNKKVKKRSFVIFSRKRINK